MRSSQINSLLTQKAQNQYYRIDIQGWPSSDGQGIDIIVKAQLEDGTSRGPIIFENISIGILNNEAEKEKLASKAQVEVFKSERIEITLIE